MDSVGKLTYRKRSRGSILVLIAFAIVGLIALTGLVVDLGYMYSVKAKLQNAADAGALAGAGRINPQLLLANYTGARNGAKQFADVNFNLTLDTNATNNSEGDIVLGFWNKNATPPSFSPSGTPINAVKVVARRADETGTGIGANSKVDLFLGKIIGINTMGAKSLAIAYRPPRARTFFLLGRDTCNTTSFPLILGPSTANMAWTSLLDPRSDSNDIRDLFFCPAEALPFDEVCGQSIYTTNGIVSSVFKAVEVDFYDPNYDAGMKTYADANHTIVATWTVITPVSFAVDPSTQPSPQPVWGYAEIVMTRACGSGGGNPCNAQGRSFSAPGGVCSGGENDVVISSITCTDCASSTSLLGALPVLAK